MIPARNVIDEHAEDLVANGELYYPSRENSQGAIPHYTLLDMLHVFSMCAVVDQTSVHTNSSAVVPAPHHISLLPAVIAF
jgi:hypothetical protein